MNESLLHYIWQFQYFDKTELLTTDGEPVTIFHTGTKNLHSGPDFSNARVRIGDIEWIGHVEIHINASAWNQHKHALDAAYDNVVLHVVWKDDEPVFRKDMTLIPTVTLKNRVSPDFLLRCNRLLHNPEQIPCSGSIEKVRDLTKLSMVERALTSRLEDKATQVLSMLAANNSDWEETCYQLLCRNFGFKTNGEPFGLLAKALPYKVVMKHADKRIQVEALLFGQAGLLDQLIQDDYSSVLQREYSLLSKKFNLNDRKLQKAQWRFLRLRPANFPTIRIAQLAALLSRQKNIFSHVINAQSYSELYKLLNAKQSEYWQHHYVFGRYITEEIASLGRMSVDNIIVNTIVPIIVAYGKAHDEQHLIDRAIGILENVQPEDNAIIKGWSKLGMRSKNAFDTQALIELYNNYCLRKRCLDCTIGSSLITAS